MVLSNKSMVSKDELHISSLALVFSVEESDRTMLSERTRRVRSVAIHPCKFVFFLRDINICFSIF